MATFWTGVTTYSFFWNDPWSCSRWHTSNNYQLTSPAVLLHQYFYVATAIYFVAGMQDVTENLYLDIAGAVINFRTM